MKKLTVNQGKIMDTAGKPVALRGTCVGGWMNMENFINGYPGSESGLRAVLADTIGPARAEFFFHRMLDNLLAEDDLAFIRSLGATVVRLPLNYRHFEDDKKPFEYLEEGFRRLDEMVDLCEKHGLYVILDLHSVQGWQNTDWHCDNDSNHTYFWQHPHFQQRYIALWKELARRYRDRDCVAGYDVMNEPLCNAPRGRFTSTERYPRNWETINGVFREVVAAIREIDPDHIIFLEGDYFAALFEGLAIPEGGNIALSSHNYTSYGFGPGAYPGTHDGETWDKEAQRAAFLGHEGTQLSRRTGCPLWVGEFGSVFNGPAGEAGDRLRALDDQLALFGEYDAHWTTWTYKDVGVMGWVTLDPESDYMQLVGASLEAKRLLDTDQWMSWLPETPAKQAVRGLESLVRQTIGDETIESEPNYRFMKQAVLCGYTGSLMQYSYAKLFKGMTEERIDRLMDSFRFANCVVNDGLAAVLKKNMGG